MSQDSKSGKLYLESGKVVQAQLSHESTEGEDALSGIISMKSPKFKYLEPDSAEAKTKDLDLPIEDLVRRITPASFESPLAEKRVPVKLLFYMTLIGTLVLLIYLIPTNIKHAAIDPSVELSAKNRLRNLIQSELSKDSPQEVAEMTPSRTANIKVIAEGKDAVPEDLRFARYLVDKGKTDAAITYYEKVLTHQPNNIAVRLELINAYIATKKPHSARVLCIKTFKKKLTPEEIGAVWQLFGQCQTD